MSNSTISTLTSGSPAQSGDTIPAARSGTNVKLPVSDFVVKAPAADQNISAHHVLPASGNTTQSLGSVAAPWNAEFRVQNGIAYADGFPGASVAAQIAAAITSFGSNKGIVVIPSTLGTGSPAAGTIPANITLIDMRGDSTPPARNDGDVAGIQVDYNGTIEGSLAGFSVFQGRTSPVQTSSAILATSKFTGTLPNANTLAGLTAEVDIVGAVTPGSGVPCAIEAYTAIRSTGGTLADVRGLTASVNLDLISSTTNVTEASSIFASPVVNSSGSSATVAKAYSLQAVQPTLGTSRNYAFYCNGSMLIPNNVNVDGIDSGGTVRRFITLTGTNDIQFKPLADANGFHFQTQGASDIAQINATGVGVFVAPAFKFHVEGSTAGDAVAKFKNTSATGFGVKFVPGTDANYGIAVSNAADSQNNFTVSGAGSLVTATATVTGATPTGSGSSVGLGTTVGFGNGTAGTAVTTTLIGTGSGPATPQTIKKYIEIDIGGSKFWIPLVQ